MENNRTLVIIKPDGVERHLTGDIISRIEDKGLNIIGLKMAKIDMEFAEKHYAETLEHTKGMGESALDNLNKFSVDPIELLGTSDVYKIGKIIREWLIEYIISGTIIVMVIEGPNAIQMIRKLVGTTLPSDSPIGTIRGDYSVDANVFSLPQKRALRNIIHASGNQEEAEYEIKLWFKENELIKS